MRKKGYREWNGRRRVAAPSCLDVQAPERQSEDRARDPDVHDMHNKQRKEWWFLKSKKLNPYETPGRAESTPGIMTRLGADLAPPRIVCMYSSFPCPMGTSATSNLALHLKRCAAPSSTQRGQQAREKIGSIGCQKITYPANCSRFLSDAIASL
jgi:hypothetical protein